MAANWRIHRRTFLRGWVRLWHCHCWMSWLPSMKAIGGTAASPGAKAIPNRMAFVYVPNGKNMVDWTPTTLGREF